MVPDQVAADLRRPELDLERDTLVVHAANGELAGWAWVHLGKHAPDRRASVVPRGSGSGRRCSTGPSSGHARPAASGWRRRSTTRTRPGPSCCDRGVRRTRHQLVARAADGPDGAAELPDGLTLAPYNETRAREVHELIEDAFSGFQPRRKSYDEWARLTVERSSFRPNASTLAYAGDELVGVVIALDLPDTNEGYVEQLAVRADHRSKGIARAMLDDTCAEMTFQAGIQPPNLAIVVVPDPLRDRHRGLRSADRHERRYVAVFEGRRRYRTAN